MAFVFQAKRWIDSPCQNSIGPGSYDAKFKSNIKSGVISPNGKSDRSYKYNESKNQSSYNKKLVISRTVQQNQNKQNKPVKKIIQRAMSAKLFATKSTLKQPIQKTNQDQQQIFLQITNSNNNSKQEFENSIIKKQFRKIKKSIHSSLTPNQSNKINIFNDKSIRNFNNQKGLASVKIQENINFLSSCFKNTNLQNIKLKKFTKNTEKGQNSFFVKQCKNFQNNCQNQNFIIASGNCKKQKFKITTSSNIKKQDSCKLSEWGDMQTTGIQDSFQQSMEYYENATPGPGEYNLRKQKPIYKSKVQRFGITQKRFKNQQGQSKLYFLNIKIPTFKKYSKAPQQKVAFGKSCNDKTKQQLTDFPVFQNNQNLEHKSIKNLIKDRKSPGSFLTKCDRFLPAKKQQYFGPDFFQKQKQQPITLPSSIFMSKVCRQPRPASPTSQIDFLGQDCYTLQKKVQKLKQKKQIIEEQIPGFYVSAPRFKYEQIQIDQQQRRPSQFSKTKMVKQGKSYTFRKQQTKKQNERPFTPTPWTYETKSRWIKPSHHVRYKF